jgi:hypothetical protein
MIDFRKQTLAFRQTATMATNDLETCAECKSIVRGGWEVEDEIYCPDCRGICIACDSVKLREDFPCSDGIVCTACCNAWEPAVVHELLRSWDARMALARVNL